MTEAVSNIGNTSGSQTSTSQNAALEQKDQFLQLLTEQLKAQNPLKPYDNQEFATQLAQFSQLEQLSDIRSILEEQAQSNVLLSQVVSNAALPGMLGKIAKAYTSHIAFDGDTPSNVGFDLGQNANSGKVTIYNETGKVVREIDVDPSMLSRGNHEFSWDGTDASGNKLAAGNYTFFADFTDSKGNSFTGNTFTHGPIEAVRFKSEGTKLVVAGQEISLGDVTDIRN